MNHADDLAYLREKMSPAAFEELIHDWANAIREAEREVAMRQGPGNFDLAWEQDGTGGNVCNTAWQPPKRKYRKRSA